MTRNFPDFIEAYVRYTKNQESSEKIHRWVAISIIAGALERKVFMPRGYYTLFPNLYVFIIGASGVVRKSTSTGIGVDLLRYLEDFNMMSERMTASSLIMQLERSGSKYSVNGREVQQSAVYCYASELSVFLQEVYGSISELLTTFYDCSPHDASKPWVYETKGEGKIRVFGPCLNILGASTPTWLVRCIPASEMEGGFSSRVVFVVENEPPKKFVAWPSVDELTASLRPRLIEDLKRIHALTGAVTVTDDARLWFESWYEAHVRALVAQKDLRFSGYFGRKSDTILKVAIVLSVSEGDSLELRTEHLERAAALLQQLEGSMFDAFGASGENENSKKLRVVWDYLAARGEVCHSELLKNFWRDIDHKTMITLMEDLQRMNYITVNPHPARRDVVYTVRDKTLRL